MENKKLFGYIGAVELSDSQKARLIQTAEAKPRRNAFRASAYALTAAVAVMFVAAGIAALYLNGAHEAKVYETEAKTDIYYSPNVSETSADTIVTTSEASTDAGSGVNYIGEVIPFGGCDWRILDIKDGNILIIREKIAEHRAFNSQQEYITWENCTLRQYLNGEYYESFDESDRARIVKTTNANPDNPWYGTDGGNDTEDYIFPLSLDEVVKYFGDSGQLDNKPNGESTLIDDRYDANRQAFNEDDDFNPKGTRLGEDGNYYDTYSGDSWGLRTPGGYSSVAVVSGIGDIYVMGIRNQDPGIGVRPAMWISIE